MISGYCEEKYIPLKKIFEDYFLKQEEIGASFAIYKEGKPLIDLHGGFKNKNNKNWEENTIVNVFSATKGIYEIIVSILIDQNILDLEKSVSYYWDAFKQSNKREIKQVFIEGKFITRAMMPISLSYDHRIIDGAEAARFCQDLKLSLGKNFAFNLSF